MDSRYLLFIKLYLKYSLVSLVILSELNIINFQTRPAAFYESRQIVLRSLPVENL